MLSLVSAILFHFGGRDQFKWLPWFNQKLWRWLMGVPLAYYYGCVYRSAYPMLLIITYFLATNVSSYGENHVFRKWFGVDGAWWVYGLLFGLASMPVLGLKLALVQALMGAISFSLLMSWSNYGFFGHKLTHKYVELAFGFLGTICLSLI